MLIRFEKGFSDESKRAWTEPSSIWAKSTNVRAPPMAGTMLAFDFTFQMIIAVKGIAKARTASIIMQVTDEDGTVIILPPKKYLEKFLNIE